MAKQYTRSFQPLVLLPLLLLLWNPEAHAADSYYTVQAGTYTPAALGYAKRQVTLLAASLREADRDHLRIVQGNRYCFVRLGRFASARAAGRVLAAVKMLVADAYVLREDSETVKTVAVYEGEEGEYYTVVAGSLNSLPEAERRFDNVAALLPVEMAGSLEMEKDGEAFRITLGRFDTYAAAEEFLTTNRAALGEAVIVKRQTADGRTTATYPESARLEGVREGAGAGEGDIAAAGPGAAARTPESVEDLLSDVSEIYFGEDYEKAEEIIRKGIERWPDNADLFAWYGATLLNRNSPEKALEYYQKAADLSPEKPVYHSGIGYSLMNIYMDRAKASAEAFGKALELDPNNVSALEGLGIVYVSMNRKDLASGLYSRLKALDADAAARLAEYISRGIDWGR